MAIYIHKYIVRIRLGEAGNYLTRDKITKINGTDIKINA